MGSISTSFTVPCPIDRAVLAVQDTLNQVGWPVLEMSSTLIVAQGPKLQPLQMYNLPKVSVKLSPVDDQTEIDVSVSIGWTLPCRRSRHSRHHTAERATRTSRAFCWPSWA